MSHSVCNSEHKYWPCLPRLNWDTPLNAIMGDEAIVHFPDARITHLITLRDLATHRSGMPAEDMLWYSGAADRQDIAE